jgi:hypothetical protein
MSPIMNERRVIALLFAGILAGLPSAHAQKKLPASGSQEVRRPAPAPLPDGTRAIAEPPAIAEPVTPHDASAKTVAVPQTPAAGWWPVVIGALVAGVLFVSAALAFVLRIRSLEALVLSAVRRIGDRHERGKDNGTRDEVADLRLACKSGFDRLHSAIGEIPEKTSLRLRGAMQASPQPNFGVSPARVAAPVASYEESPREPEDPVAQLLGVANRIVQQSSITLEAFRASMGAFSGRVSPWPNAIDGTPAAFIVEHRGSCYAVPNVMKPARLPNEWFNRSEFGVNDEIQRVVALPRLRRRGGDDFEVQEAGVFSR